MRRRQGSSRSRRHFPGSMKHGLVEFQVGTKRLTAHASGFEKETVHVIMCYPETVLGDGLRCGGFGAQNRAAVLAACQATVDFGERENADENNQESRLSTPSP